MATRTMKPRERQAAGATPLLLGIESGATRTVAIAAGGDLAAPVRREFGPANLQMLNDGQLARRLNVIARSMPRPDSLAIGMAGARTDADHARLRRAAAAVWPGVPCHATSDLETCLVAVDGPRPTGRRATAARARGSARRGPDALPRVLIVSGTGSCCFARAADGRTARLGGWGHVLGDSGSGYDIALTAARAVVHASDCDRQWPALGRRFLRALALDEPEDLVNWAQSAGKGDIAALAVEVFAASEDGDPIAKEVLEFAARSLAADGFACARLVAKPGTPVQFVMAGSVLLRQPRFAARVRRALRHLWPTALVSPLKGDSAWGAVALARQNAGASAPRTRSD